MKSAIVVVLLIGALTTCQGQQVPSCFGFPNGFLFNNPMADANYFLCMDNVPVPMQCQAGFVFCQGGNFCMLSCPVQQTIPTTTPVPLTMPTQPQTVTIATPPPTTPATTTSTTNLATTTSTPATVTSTMTPETTIMTTTTAAPATAASPVDCSDVQDGTLFANPSSCSAYYICINGTAKAGLCLGSFAFNESTGTCSTTRC